MTIIHGTPTGYDQGCRGPSCENHRSSTLMTCTEAHMRYQGDYSYIKAVDAGTATAEKETYVVPKGVHLVAETAAQAAARPKRASRAKPKTAKRVPPKRTKALHGTPSGYTQLKCRNECPKEFTCRMAASLARKNRLQEVRELAAQALAA